MPSRPPYTPSKVDPADPTKQTADDRVSVIDLKASPPRVEWDGKTLRDTGQRVKVNGGPAAIRTVEK